MYGNYKPAAKEGVNMPPIGLMYIASYLIKNRYPGVYILDTEVSGYSIDKVKEYKPDVIGLTSVSPNFESACNIANEIKKHLDVPVVLGGVHATVDTMNAMKQCTSFDAAVFGEGEETAKELIEVIDRKSEYQDIKGLSFRRGHEVFKSAYRPPIENLDELPFPARHLIDNTKYTFSVTKEGIIPLTMMCTSRGCPYECVFCASKTIWGKKTRFRSAENVVKEIEEVIKLGIKYIAFSDDTFTLNRNRVIEICNAIISKNLKIKWQMMTRANLFDEELLELMKKAGLVRMSVGIESGDPEILKKIKKGVTLEDITNAYRIADKVGIETRGSIMLGHPYETRESAMRTLRFVRGLSDCKQLYVNVSTPYPGTELLEMARRGEGGIKLLTDDLSQYRRYGNAVVDVNDLKRKDLIGLQKLGFWMFYMTPARIVYNIFRAGIVAGLRNAIAFVRSLIS